MYRVLPLLTILLVAAMVLDAAVNAAERQPRRGRGRLARAYTHVHDAVGATYYAPPPEAYDAGWNHPQMYPKYYAGFHFREMQFYGYPFGEEEGFRGTPW